MSKLEQFRELKRLIKLSAREDRSEETQQAKESSKRAFRQTAIVMDQEKTNNYAITFGQFRDWEQGKWVDSPSQGPVKKDSKHEPLWIRLLSILSGLAILVGFIMVVAIELSHLGLQDDSAPTAIMIVSAILLIAGLAVYIAVRGIVAYRDRRRWLRLMREQDLEKQNS